MHDVAAAKIHLLVVVGDETGSASVICPPPSCYISHHRGVYMHGIWYIKLHTLAFHTQPRCTMHVRVAKKPYQECVVSVRIKRRKERKYEFDNNVI